MSSPILRLGSKVIPRSQTVQGHWIKGDLTGREMVSILFGWI